MSAARVGFSPFSLECNLDRLVKPTYSVGRKFNNFVLPGHSPSNYLSIEPIWAFWSPLVLEWCSANRLDQISFIVWLVKPSDTVGLKFTNFVLPGHSPSNYLLFEPIWAFWNPLVLSWCSANRFDQISFIYSDIERKILYYTDVREAAHLRNSDRPGLCWKCS